MREKRLRSHYFKIFREVLLIALLIVYPLRHINIGLDLWDTGYGYANFKYMGLEHMDSMWYFATYFSNIVGHLLNDLPFADTLLGMNLYTGLFVSSIAVLSYWFMTRKIGLSSWIAFIGEIMAISLCWCPTAALYNYLTYLFLTVGVIFIYQGLTGGNKWYLFAAGVCLGINLFVRFSNLSEVALILAVWVYILLEAKENYKITRQLDIKKVIKRECIDTLWCIGGYFAVLAAFFAYIHIKYGINQYIESIARLFSMTDSASDYKLDSMVRQLYYTFRDQLHWMIILAVLALIGMILSLVFQKTKPVFTWICRLLWIGLFIGVLFLFYQRTFFTFDYYNYSSIFQICVCFFIETLLLFGVIIVLPSYNSKDKLICGLLTLCIFIMSVGGNNGIYTCINSLFLIAPYVIGKIYFFVTGDGTYKLGNNQISLFPMKSITTIFMLLVLIQSVSFGAYFSYEEAKGARNTVAEVKNNDILYKIRMNPVRAKWMEEIGNYINDNHLKGQEVILYGNIPSLSFYLDLPPAFNSWCDLDSYSYDSMKLDLFKLTGLINSGDKKYPLIIIDKNHSFSDIEGEKWKLIVRFIEEHQYEIDFQNEKFSVWRTSI